MCRLEMPKKFIFASANGRVNGENSQRKNYSYQYRWELPEPSHYNLQEEYRLEVLKTIYYVLPLPILFCKARENSNFHPSK